ncbi:RES domain-containing protein [Sphaerotilus hippei]|uniref:RES domain-containing protein n=1 Tax=Sphaerotilus hippei TaxID=744406 RepID=A0A318GVT0_9BURK|nr:RES family NAD+ phosphorylase [Sphaerotilus hippei]PXW93265.1 RES domain-containing protein [Sphaerotilus hippei]
MIHQVAYAPESFNPGVDASGSPVKPTRFAPIRDRHAQVVPYLYGGSSRDCALFETIFHHVPIDALDKFVDLDDFAQRGHGQIVPQRELLLADLTSEGLHRLRVPKEELIASPPAAYGMTARWAQALHRQFTQVDGLIWMSRQRDRDRALLLFGDRVATALTGLRIGGPLRSNDELRQAILAAALRAGIEAC